MDAAARQHESSSGEEAFEAGRPFLRERPPRCEGSPERWLCSHPPSCGGGGFGGDTGGARSSDVTGQEEAASEQECDGR